ncbi:MAG TPA: FtsX-like permease family protein, partial [Planctomycetota bacterium]|nr:FtsX-like permease family protein [Planctomycetota bacterium]
LAGAVDGAALRELPAELFPSSLELYLEPNLAAADIEALATRLGTLSGVASLERYQSFFERLDRMIGAGRWGTIGLSLLVALLVFGVVGSTIRLSLARRSREIEVMKLVGAQPSFIRGPFIVEGVFQGAAAALIAIVTLAVFYFGFRSEIDLGVRLFFGGETLFFGPGAIVGFLIGGALMGGLGSTLSLRRYLA